MKGSRMNLSFGPEIIFDDAEFQLGDRDKAGIVGVNGAGKTTLFRLLRGEIALDGGTLSVGRARVGYLPQEIVFDRKNETVWEYLSAGRPLQKIKTELEEIYRRLETAPEAEHERLLERMAYLQEQLDYFDQYEADDILLSLMEEMKIDADLLDRRLAELSGGQKSSWRLPGYFIPNRKFCVWTSRPTIWMRQPGIMLPIILKITKVRY